MECFSNGNPATTSQSFLHGHCSAHALGEGMRHFGTVWSIQNLDKKSTAFRQKCDIILALWLF